MWPHGEWSLGYRAIEPDERLDERPSWRVSDKAVSAAQCLPNGWHVPLNLSDAPNSTKRPPRGQKGITGYGQQMVKAAGYLMGKRWPAHRKTFGTVTLPEMSEETRREVVLAWPDLTRELIRWLARRLEAQGLPLLVVSVTEVQPRRLQQTGQACLHWHLIWLNHPGRAGNWAVDPVELRAWLNGLLSRKIPSYQGGHVNVNVKSVEGEVARYLAKYMSKGKQQVAEAMQDWGEGVCPRTWWNMTKPARDAVKNELKHGENVGKALENELEELWAGNREGAVAFLRPIELELGGLQVVVGWRGRFESEHAQSVREMIESLDIERFERMTELCQTSPLTSQLS